jgi:hypothetical protein
VTDKETMTRAEVACSRWSGEEGRVLGWGNSTCKDPEKRIRATLTEMENQGRNPLEMGAWS